MLYTRDEGVVELEIIDISDNETRLNRERERRRQQLRQKQARARQRQKQIRKRRRQIFMMKTAVLCCLLLLVVLIALVLHQMFPAPRQKDSIPDRVYMEEREVINAKPLQGPGITEDFLTVNEYSRPGEALETVNNIFVHYTANPGTSAAQNRSYFENLGLTGETSASAHFVIGYEGEIIQCIPLDEIAYAVQKRNYDSISIECCYLDGNGKFTQATYNSLVELSSWLLGRYRLSPTDLRRHYDEGGKMCPLYYVEHEEAWNQFIRDVEDYMRNKSEV